MVHTNHKNLLSFLEKKIKPKTNSIIKTICLLRFHNQTHKKNIGANVLNRNPDYKNPERTIKPILVKKRLHANNRNNGKKRKHD